VAHDKIGEQNRNFSGCNERSSTAMSETQHLTSQHSPELAILEQKTCQRWSVEKFCESEFSSLSERAFGLDCIHDAHKIGVSRLARD
jgi:hypothetical protein